MCEMSLKTISGEEGRKHLLGGFQVSLSKRCLLGMDTSVLAHTCPPGIPCHPVHPVSPREDISGQETRHFPVAPKIGVHTELSPYQWLEQKVGPRAMDCVSKRCPIHGVGGREEAVCA